MKPKTKEEDLEAYKNYQEFKENLLKNNAENEKEN